MRLPALPLFLALGLVLPLEASGLDDLRSALQRLQGGDPVKAALEHSFWRQTTDDKKPMVSQGQATAQVEDGPAGLRMTWSRATLDQAAKELAVQEREPDRPAPTRLALKNLDPVETAEALDHAGALLRDLAQAQLQEERSEGWHGRPARLLVLKLTPSLPANQRKYLKELKVEAKVWLGADGLPLAFSSTVAFKGSRMLIRFEGGSSQEREFAKVGRRLVVTRASTEDRSAGLGTTHLSKKVTTLSLM